MAKKNKKFAPKREINLGPATYVVERVFADQHTVSDLIANKIIHDKKTNKKPKRYENVG